MAMLGLRCCMRALVVASGGNSLIVVQSPRGSGFSSCGAGAVERRFVAAQLAEAHLPHSMWDLPGEGSEPVSPALAGGLPTAGPPGRSSLHVLIELNAKKKGFHVSLFL